MRKIHECNLALWDDPLNANDLKRHRNHFSCHNQVSMSCYPWWDCMYDRKTMCTETKYEKINIGLELYDIATK